MTATTDQDIQQIKDLITGLDRKIDALDRKIDVGFAQVEVKLVTLERKIDVGVAEVKGDIKTLDSKLEERTNNFSQRLDGKEILERNISTGVIVTIVGGLLLALSKVLFFGKVL